MSGLVAIVAHDGPTPSSNMELEALACAYERLRGEGGREHAPAGEWAGLTLLHADASDRAARPADASWVLSCGRVHDPEGCGENDVARLEGQFVWARRDAQRDTFEIANDPFGMRSLFVARRGDRTYFSTSALALAAHLRARPDLSGVNVFLRAGFHFGTRTNWEGIERVDPATRFTFTREGVTRETYWAPEIDARVYSLGLDDAVRHCLDVASATYPMLYGADSGDSWADLTGGWDSRLMTALLARAGVDFIANTAGEERHRDVQVARRVARAAGWDWRRFDIPAEWPRLLPDCAELALAWGDCHLDALQLAEVLWGHQAKAREHKHLFIGGGGEHFRDRAWQQEFLSGGRSRQVNFDNYVDMRLLKPFDDSVFVSDPTPEVRADLGARMRARAEPYSQYLNSTQLDVMHAYKNTGHFGAYLSAGAGAIAAELPFYTRPVFTAAFSTSHRHRGSHRLMRQLLHALDPRIAAVETEAGGPATPMGVRNSYRFLPYYATIGRRAARKIGQRMPWRLPASSGPVNPSRAAARAAFVASFDDGRALRHAAMRCAPLFKGNALEDLLARAGTTTGAESALLGRILSLELALRATDTAIEDPRSRRTARDTGAHAVTGAAHRSAAAGSSSWRSQLARRGVPR